MQIQINIICWTITDNPRRFPVKEAVYRSSLFLNQIVWFLSADERTAMVNLRLSITQREPDDLCPFVRRGHLNSLSFGLVVAVGMNAVIRTFPCIRPSFRSSVRARSSVRPIVRRSVRPSSCPSVLPSVRPSVGSSVLPCVRPSVRPVSPSVRPFVYPTDVPKTRLVAYPKGAWHQTRPPVLEKIISAVPLMYAPPTHVAEEKNHKIGFIKSWNAIKYWHLSRDNLSKCFDSSLHKIIDFNNFLLDFFLSTFFAFDFIEEYQCFSAFTVRFIYFLLTEVQLSIPKFFEHFMKFCIMSA